LKTIKLALGMLKTHRLRLVYKKTVTTAVVANREVLQLKKSHFPKSLRLLL
jgi:hypothetical protein